jgi:hypothetical protein
MFRLPFQAVVVLAGLLPGDTPQGRAGGEGPTPWQFTFVRVEYDSEGGYGEAYYDYDGRFWLRWQTDYPEAERNFLYRIGQLTTIKANPEPISLRLTDPRLDDYPFIYMCDVGWQRLSRAEVRALRRYLIRGGFLWVDDFWGTAEWRNFERNMREVFPEYDWRRIPNDHPILNIVFPLDECPQVPAKIFWDSWRESFDHPDVHRQPAGGLRGVRTVNFMGLFNKAGRLMVVATHNTDIGDGWERETEHAEFFKEFSVKSFAMGINILAYALTH